MVPPFEGRNREVGRMAFIQPTENSRVNEPVGFVLLFLAVGLGLSLVSHYPFDPSWNAFGVADDPANLLGAPGAFVSDIALQVLGLPAFLLPVSLIVLAWRWVRSSAIPSLFARLMGLFLLLLVSCAAFGLSSLQNLWMGTIQPGGVLGQFLGQVLVGYLNLTGAIMTLLAGAVVAPYLLTSSSLHVVLSWWVDRRGQAALLWQNWRSWLQRHYERVVQKRKVHRQQKRAARSDGPTDEPRPNQAVAQAALSDSAVSDSLPPIVPYEGVEEVNEVLPQKFENEYSREAELASGQANLPLQQGAAVIEPPRTYHIPSTLLLAAPAPRGSYNPEELQRLASQICAKFEEFGVGGSVTQINPGPVVTTFEFKPNPGIKCSKVTTLSEDLCLALECESIRIERIPGKSTVGLEVPNQKREIISLREVLESPEFTESPSCLTMALGKDINGRLSTTQLDSMPHLLIAGSTGSGKSVLINSFLLSILYKATPEDVRFIMIDPKTVELGLYEGIPHLLTPVITDMKKAANALRNATGEMERRLKLLAEHGVRNIDQYNRKMGAMDEESLLPDENGDIPPRHLSYIVIVIDELADLMVTEGRRVEESIMRLAQMARAVGIHLILATQRPSVDVITGLIKANIPVRLSFRLATRVDSRTILDSIGAEALLGRGDMLFLPPGSGRMIRLHGPLVTSEEVSAVVSAWKEQGLPDYQTALLAPPGDDGREDEIVGEDGLGSDDPVYEDALRVVLEMGKASTSTLQRRLSLGYGRAARILDAMERQGIIGPPNGPRPRAVLKRPDTPVSA